MKIAVVCCTYLRPEGLGRVVQCFLNQDYPDREMVILDDAGQYDGQEGEGWMLVSRSKRYPCLGAKRYAAAKLVSKDVDAIAIWDDDDVYLPWALSASVAALKVAPWSRPSLVLHEKSEGVLTQHETGGLFHGGWAYMKDPFDRVGGYPNRNNGEDQGLAKRFRRNEITSADPCSLGFTPFYMFSWGANGSYHLSGLPEGGYESLRRTVTKAEISIALPERFRNPVILPEIHPRRF